MMVTRDPELPLLSRLGRLDLGLGLVDVLADGRPELLRVLGQELAEPLVVLELLDRLRRRCVGHRLAADLRGLALRVAHRVLLT